MATRENSSQFSRFMDVNVTRYLHAIPLNMPIAIDGVYEVE